MNDAKDLYCLRCRKIGRHVRVPEDDILDRDAYACDECHEVYFRLTDAAIARRAPSLDSSSHTLDGSDNHERDSESARRCDR